VPITGKAERTDGKNPYGVIAVLPAEPSAKIAAAHTHKFIAKSKSLLRKRRSGSWRKPSASWRLIAMRS
jgi:hypothetical protein